VLAALKHRRVRVRRLSPMVSPVVRMLSTDKDESVLQTGEAALNSAAQLASKSMWPDSKSRCDSLVD